MKTTAITLAAALGALATFADIVSAAHWTFVSPKGEWSKEPAKSGPKVAAFAKTIVNESDVAKVEISAAALGCYELYVNGTLVSSAEDGNRFACILIRRAIAFAYNSLADCSYEKYNTGCFCMAI
jgi:hypothetical protein